MQTIAQTSDKEDVKALWAYAFNEQEPFLSEYFDNFWKAENAVIHKDMHLIGALQMIPYNICLRGAFTPASYIVGVSITPEERGKGYSTQLMRDCLLEQKKRGETISLLIPFSYEFYKKLGYRLCYTLDIYKTETLNIPSFNKDYSIQKMSIENFTDLNNVYIEFCQNKNGYILREKNDWEYIFFEHKLSGGFIYGAYSNGQLKGYISYNKSSEGLYVRELIYTNRDSLFCLLAFIKSHFSAKQSIKIRTSSDNMLLNVLKEPKNTLKVAPTVMARIVDVPSALALSDIGDLKIYVYDELLPENCGVYKKEAENIIKTDESYDFLIDIGTLTQLVMGFYSASELNFLGLIEADTKIIEKLNKIFPKTENYINHIMEE